MSKAKPKPLNSALSCTWHLIMSTKPSYFFFFKNTLLNWKIPKNLNAFNQWTTNALFTDCMILSGTFWKQLWVTNICCNIFGNVQPFSPNHIWKKLGFFLFWGIKIFYAVFKKSVRNKNCVSSKPHYLMKFNRRSPNFSTFNSHLHRFLVSLFIMVLC